MRAEAGRALDSHGRGACAAAWIGLGLVTGTSSTSAASRGGRWSVRMTWPMWRVQRSPSHWLIGDRGSGVLRICALNSRMTTAMPAIRRCANCMPCASCRRRPRCPTRFALTGRMLGAGERRRGRSDDLADTALRGDAGATAGNLVLHDHALAAAELRRKLEAQLVGSAGGAARSISGRIGVSAARL